MSDLVTKCTVCGALIDEEDLFCANCGTEAPHSGDAKPQESAVAQYNFRCQGCGASMSYDASAGSLRCPFCGSVKLESEQDAKTIKPNRVVPFAIEKHQAEQSMRKWLGSSFWRPGDLARMAQITKMTAVYVPYWVFSARTHTYWCADTSQTPFGARGDWFPMTGEHQGHHRGLLVGASGALKPGETSAISPFDLAAGVDPEQVDLQNMIVEQFGLARKYARPMARRGIEQIEAQDCRGYVPGRCRNMHVNVRVQDQTSEPVLLPVWIMAYRYRDQVYRFLVNGQNGRATGTAPISWPKIILVVLGVIAALIFVLIVIGVVANS